MKHRFGMLSGLVVLGVVSLGFLSGIFVNGSVEAAKPGQNFTHTLSDAANCDLTTDFTWDNKAFAHKKGYYRLFLWGQDGTGAVRLAGNSGFMEIAKGTPSISIHQEWGLQNAGDEYRGRILLYSSKGKDGAERGRRLLLDEELIPC
jgi:hypothetical protein